VHRSGLVVVLIKSKLLLECIGISLTKPEQIRLCSECIFKGQIWKIELKIGCDWCRNVVNCQSP